MKMRQRKYSFLACSCKETTWFLCALNCAHRREYVYGYVLGGVRRSLFHLSISSRINFEIQGAGFFFTRTDLIGAWTSRTSWKRVLKTLIFHQHHQTDQQLCWSILFMYHLCCYPASHHIIMPSHPFSAVSHVHATICAEI